MKIPEKFYKQNIPPKAVTVAELVSLLLELPQDLTVCDGIHVEVCNVGHFNGPHVWFNHPDDYDDD